MHLNIDWVFIKHGLNYLHMFKDILTLQSMLYYQLVMNDIKNFMSWYIMRVIITINQYYHFKLTTTVLYRT